MNTKNNLESFGKLPRDGLNLKEHLLQIEKSFIEQALKSTGGNKNRASKLLGLNRTTLIEKLKEKLTLISLILGKFYSLETNLKCRPFVRFQLKRLKVSQSTINSIYAEEKNFQSEKFSLQKFDMVID